MTTLQEYLNNLTNKAEIKEINIEKINQERKSQGTTEFLEGGELDLKEFLKLERLEINQQFLKSPLSKINVKGLVNLQEFVLPKSEEDNDEDKKLWNELGIAEDADKQKVVKEIKKLVKLWSNQNSKKVNIYFVTTKAPREQLKEGITGITENKNDEYNIYLQLERKDNSLIFFSFSQELAAIKISKSKPLFWQQSEEEKMWTKENVGDGYKKDFELLLNPSNFPIEKLEMKELLSVYCPDSSVEGLDNIHTIVMKEIIDKTWKEFWSELMKLTDAELKKNPSEEDLKKLRIKLIIGYNQSDSKYDIQIYYHSQIPFKKKIKKMINSVPLELEIEYLKQKQEQLPTTENFDKLTKQNQLLDTYLHRRVDKKNYQEVKEKISKIN